MTAKRQAQELIDRFNSIEMEKPIFIMSRGQAKECALICAQYIIDSNPHSNPLNTDGDSTMGFWIEVKQEIEKL